MVSLRPRVRIAWWAAVMATAAAYVVRAVVVLGGDFHPQLPADAVIGALLAVLLVGRILVARWTAREGGGGNAAPRTRTGAGNDDRPGAGASRE